MINLRDLDILSLPKAASAIVIVAFLYSLAFNIGYFNYFDVSFIRFFSVTDHLNNALNNIFYALVGILVGEVMASRFPRFTNSSSKKVIIRWIPFTIGLLIWIFTLLFVGLNPLTLAWFWILFANDIIIYFTRDETGNFLVSRVFHILLLTTVLAFFLGGSSANAILGSKVNDYRFIYEIAGQKIEETGRLARAGENWILLIDDKNDVKIINSANVTMMNVGKRETVQPIVDFDGLARSLGSYWK